MRDLAVRLTADTRGCEEHGNADMTEPRIYKGIARQPECRVCRRNRDSKRHYGGPRCVNGHLKTLLTWRYVGKNLYRSCRTCDLNASRARYARTKQAKGESNAEPMG